MAQQQGQKEFPEQFLFPESYQAPLSERIIFSGNLTKYYDELLYKLQSIGKKSLLIDGLYEIPQLVGFDQNNQVVVLVFRTLEQDQFGESEYLISSLDNKWIVHINIYEEENVFFDICYKIIETNFQNIFWESFMYDDEGNYEGQLLIDELDIKPMRNPLYLDRNITDGD